MLACTILGFAAFCLFDAKTVAEAGGPGHWVFIPCLMAGLAVGTAILIWGG